MFFYPVLPKLSVISGAHCTIWHTNQAIHCKRCNSDEYRTVDFNKCEAYDAHPSTTVFKFDEDPRPNILLCKNSAYYNMERWIKNIPNKRHCYGKIRQMWGTKRCPSWIRKRSPGRGYHESRLGNRNATLPGN